MKCWFKLWSNWKTRQMIELLAWRQNSTKLLLLLRLANDVSFVFISQYDQKYDLVP